MIDHLSYSAIRLYSCDRLLFKRRYIDKFYDDEPKNLAMVEGALAHKVIESLILFPKQKRKQLEAYIRQIVTSEPRLMFGSPEACKLPTDYLTNHTIERLEHCAAVWLLQTEAWRKTHEVVDVETPYIDFLKDSHGFSLQIPFKTVADCISKEGERYYIHDWKFGAKLPTTVTGYDMFIYQFQFAPYALALQERTGSQEIHGVYHFFKKDPYKRPISGESPIEFAARHARDIAIVMPDQRFLDGFFLFCRGIIAEIQGTPIKDATGFPLALPNPFDRMSGQASWEVFLKQYIDRPLL